jgi:hypothetical protein
MLAKTAGQASWTLVEWPAGQEALCPSTGTAQPALGVVSGDFEC